MAEINNKPKTSMPYEKDVLLYEQKISVFYYCF